MPPAARLTDMHTCPMVTGIVPHVGGPILPPCEPTVLIGMLPAARVGDMATCVGPPDSIAMGSPTVLIGNMMAARLGDPTVHGGVIVRQGIHCHDRRFLVKAARSVSRPRLVRPSVSIDSTTRRLGRGPTKRRSGSQFWNLSHASFCWK